MKVYLVTSNKYTKKLCPINVYFLNKYWSNIDITIVGYEDVLELKNLPNNVTVECVGEQSKFGKTWTNGLIPFFKSIPEKYFTLILDDHILLNEVDNKKLSILEKYFINDKADKAMIGGGIPLSEATQVNSNILLFKQNANYRTSLHPAIWKKEYFLKYLKPDMTSWDFELKNNIDAMFDGANIINLLYDYPNERHLYSYLELYTKGIINIDSNGEVIANQPSAKFFNKEDVKKVWDCTIEKENEG